jgi:hypothetical protein
MDLINIIYQLETFLKLAFLPLALFWPGLGAKLSLAICLLAILRKNKLPQFNKEYLIQVIQDEYFFLLFGQLSLLTSSLTLSLYNLPCGIHFFFALAEYSVVKQVGGAELVARAQTIRFHKHNIMYSKAQVEICLLLGLFTLVCLRLEGIMPFVMAGQMQLFKFQVNLYSRRAYE